MTAWYLISVRHPVEGQTPRKPWSRTAPVEPNHFVHSDFDYIGLFYTYKHRKAWKIATARSRTYRLRRGR